MNRTTPWLTIVLVLAIGLVVGGIGSWLFFNKPIFAISSTLSRIYISIIGSFVVTFVVLLARSIFFLVRDALPAGVLFHGIANSSLPCLVYIIRMHDMKKVGEFITPNPEYSPGLRTIKYSIRKNTPWITSTAEAETLSLILNVLGQIGRIENIELTYADKEYDRWDAPMFLLGGSWKTIQAFRTCKPYFDLDRVGFRLRATEKLFAPQYGDQDLGLLEKMINPMNGHPVWVIMGWRGNGTIAAAHCLVRWWKYLGKLYGKKPFGLLVSMDDKAGPQMSKVRVIHPEPHPLNRILHPIAWHRVKSKLDKDSMGVSTASSEKSAKGGA